MALHIADMEVDQLATELARLDQISKTEALRRLLRREIASRTLQKQRQPFAEIASKMIAEAKQQRLQPAGKGEFDDLWGM